MHTLRPTILVVDDELSVRRSLNVLLKKKYDILLSADAEDALLKLKKEHVDLLLLDLNLPDISGVEILKQIGKIDEKLSVIVLTAVKETRIAVEAMRLGAYDYITKPFEISELRALIDKALEKRDLLKENVVLKDEILKNGFGEIIGQSEKLKEIIKLIEKAAKSDCTVLIGGESGTGKELLTRAIHMRSSRALKPFVVVNCAAIPDHLLESELFGFERGSFTGAYERKEGKFEMADKGTLFLDEIGSMSLHLQAKILRVLQESKEGLKEVERLGSIKMIPVDVRIIAATNIDLKQAVREGKFREDLYYRLNVLPIYIPPLRERKEDVLLLINYFIEKFSKKMRKNIKAVSKEALELLINYRWPGNVRELENLIERIVTLNEKEEIDIEDLPLEILINRSGVEEDWARGMDINLKEAIEQLERQFIKRALKKTKGNQNKASEILGIHRNTLFTKISQLGIREEN